MSVAEILKAGGPLAQRHGRYEDRREQVELAAAVEKTLAEGGHLLAEAGTGVGKSFAYLIPAIERSQNEKPVLISTHTISLQEQLIQKDIPFLRSVLKDEFTAVLAKGRSNYLGLRRLNLALQRAPTLLGDQGQTAELRRILEWSSRTGDGSLSDLEPSPSPPVWSLANSEHGNCMGTKCKTYRPCFYFRARRRMWNSNLLIVNHHLFFTDLKVRRSGGKFLPDYQAVIFDEAHTLEEVASEHLGTDVSHRSVRYLLHQLVHAETEGGFLVGFPGAEKAVTLARRAHSESDDFFFRIREWAISKGPRNGRIHRPGFIPNDLTPALHDLAAELGRTLEHARSEEEETEMSAFAQKAGFLADSIEAVVNMDFPGQVYWVEADAANEQKVALKSSPVNIGETLRQELFDKVRATVLTSATLSAGGEKGFEYLLGRLGLAGHPKVRTLRLGSPFDYESNVTLHLAASMPPPSEEGKYEAALADRLPKYLDLTGGRAFVLFTSYRLMKKVARDLAAFCRERGWPLLVQGEGMPRNRMLERFKEGPPSVLFGTDSFWAGVDVPGPALSNVIITRLPFDVPDQPVIQARIEEIERRGGNPFQEYTLPNAILMFRQGFGRLIRTKEDTGVVVILDNRIVHKYYGRLFLEAIPKCKVVRE